MEFFFSLYYNIIMKPPNYGHNGPYKFVHKLPSQCSWAFIFLNIDFHRTEHLPRVKIEVGGVNVAAIPYG